MTTIRDAIIAPANARNINKFIFLNDKNKFYKSSYTKNFLFYNFKKGQSPIKNCQMAELVDVISSLVILWLKIETNV